MLVHFNIRLHQMQYEYIIFLFGVFKYKCSEEYLYNPSTGNLVWSSTFQCAFGTVWKIRRGMFIWY